MQTQIRWGFRSKYQSPWFMLWKEYYHGDEVVFARVLFSVGG